jgi:hypothetical protein
MRLVPADQLELDPFSGSVLFLQPEEGYRDDPVLALQWSLAETTEMGPIPVAAKRTRGAQHAGAGI